MDILHNVGGVAVPGVDICCGYLCGCVVDILHNAGVAVPGHTKYPHLGQVWIFYVDICVDICVDILWIFCIMLVVAVPGVGKLQLLRTADLQVHGM